MLINQTEYVKTVGNISDLNKVYLGFHEGLQYSVLGPAHIPDGLDFQATSYGSHTECRMVTIRCGAESTYRNVPINGSDSVYNFACDDSPYGPNMTGNFLFLGQEIESYRGGINNQSTDTVIENVNTMRQSNFTFGFQYFGDSAKQNQIPLPISLDSGLADDINGPITNITNQYFWAVAFALDIQLDTRNSTPWAGLNVSDTKIGAEGIMSCETNISDIVRLAHSPLLQTSSPALISIYWHCPFPSNSH